MDEVCLLMLKLDVLEMEILKWRQNFIRRAGTAVLVEFQLGEKLFASK